MLMIIHQKGTRYRLSISDDAKKSLLALTGCNEQFSNDFVECLNHIFNDYDTVVSILNEKGDMNEQLLCHDSPLASAFDWVLSTKTVIRRYGQAEWDSDGGHGTYIPANGCPYQFIYDKIGDFINSYPDISIEMLDKDST